VKRRKLWLLKIEGKSNSSTPDGVAHCDLEDLDDEEGSVRVKTQMRIFSEQDIERVAGGEAGENEGGRTR
jgi:hypothetical protein